MPFRGHFRRFCQLFSEHGDTENEIFVSPCLCVENSVEKEEAWQSFVTALPRFFFVISTIRLFRLFVGRRLYGFLLDEVEHILAVGLNAVVLLA